MSPLVASAYAAVVRFARRAERLARRLLRRPRAQVVQVRAGGAIAFGGRVSALKGLGDDASDERKLAYLLGQEQEAQRRLNELERRVGEQYDERRRELEALHVEFHEHVAASLRAHGERRIGLRRLGIACIVVGTPLVAIASLL